MGKIKNNPNMVFDQTKRRWVRKDKGKPMKKDSQLSTIIAASHNDIPHIVESVNTPKGKGSALSMLSATFLMWMMFLVPM